jgi:pimeloyl-ACP methyl ester carboxylesterase
MTAPQTQTLETPGAVLAYDVRPGSGTEPPLLLIGSPMGAAGFGTLAAHFRDRTVVTYDPRGVERSRRTDGATETTPEEHAEDLSRLIATVDAGPVDVFASSGGAVNALVLVARHPEQVRTLVAHEPPALQLLPDREQALAATRQVRDAYRARGFGAGMAGFIRLVGHRGPVPDDLGDLPDRRLRAAGRGRRLAGGRLARAQPDQLHAPRARPGGAAERLDADRGRGR